MNKKLLIFLRANKFRDNDEIRFEVKNYNKTFDVNFYSLKSSAAFLYNSSTYSLRFFFRLIYISLSTSDCLSSSPPEISPKSSSPVKSPGLLVYLSSSSFSYTDFSKSGILAFKLSTKLFRSISY